MSARFGLDSTGEVPSRAHHAVGSTVALRYLSRYTAKVITRQEHEHYRAAGIDLCLVFEDSATNALGGYDAGKSDAQFALSQAHAILGTPPRPLCVTFAVDYDPAGGARHTDPYFDGCAAVFGHVRCGPYGGKEVVSHQANRGFKMLWQTYAWSAGAFDPRAQLYQYSNGHLIGGVDTDFNHIYGHDFGQLDRKPTGPLDLHHYGRFPLGPLAVDCRDGKDRVLYERAAVIEYDHLRAHPFVHRRRLHVLRTTLLDLSDSVLAQAHTTSPPCWLAHHLGWRFQQLIRRAHGEKLA